MRGWGGVAMRAIRSIKSMENGKGMQYAPRLRIGGPSQSLLSIASTRRLHQKKKRNPDVMMILMSDGDELSLSLKQGKNKACGIFSSSRAAL